MKIIAWAGVIILGAVSLIAIVINYLYVGLEIRAKQGEKVPSNIPIVGGLLGIFALKGFFMLRAWPSPHAVDWSWYYLLPPALDPGCYFAYLVISPVVRIIRGYTR